MGNQKLITNCILLVITHCLACASDYEGDTDLSDGQLGAEDRLEGEEKAFSLSSLFRCFRFRRHPPHGSGGRDTHAAHVSAEPANDRYSIAVAADAIVDGGYDAEIRRLANVGMDQEAVQALEDFADDATVIAGNLNRANRRLDVDGAELAAQVHQAQDTLNAAWHVAHIVHAVQEDGYHGIQAHRQDVRAIVQEAQNATSHDSDAAIPVPISMMSSVTQLTGAFQIRKK